MAAPSKPLRPHAAPALFQLLSDSSLSRAALNACGVPLALLEADPTHCSVSYVNSAFAAYFGFAESEVLGRSLAVLVLRGDEPLLQRLLADAPSRRPLTAWHKDGASLAVEVAFAPVHNADGRLTHWVLTFSDRGEVEQLRGEIESMKTLAAGSLTLRLDAPGQPARGAQQPRVEIPAADELHAERQSTRPLHQR
jgi:PAS domain S-box-containing protein